LSERPSGLPEHRGGEDSPHSWHGTENLDVTVLLKIFVAGKFFDQLLDALAQLRLLLAAGARIRWFATDGTHDVSGLEPAAATRIEFAEGDPLAADLGGVIAIFCAGAGDIGIAMSLRARAVGLPVNVMDDLTHSTFIFPAIVDRGDVVVAVGTGGASPVVARRVRERIEAVLPARIGNWSLISLQQRLVKTGGRLVKHTRYYWLLLAEGI